ncbi:MAG: c(7)-type cytochrome triheme domain-containing protein [Verrucomicrobiota bacterium]
MPSLLGVLLLILSTTFAEANWQFPPAPPPEEFGNLLIDRTSTKNRVKPVTFSHWSHRRKYTCQVCHSELEFGWKTNVTPITEENNLAGRYCGACHDGRTAFAHDKASCAKCHNGDRGYGKGKFDELAPLPHTRSGNHIDWVLALEEKAIAPARFLKVKPPPGIAYDKELLLEAEWERVPPAIFPHRSHTAWLECSNCHPEIFNIQKKTTTHFEMKMNLAGEFCGVCHMTVAFPMTDCRRCHPAMKGW